jgi:hypothetical protein
MPREDVSPVAVDNSGTTYTRAAARLIDFGAAEIAVHKL